MAWDYDTKASAKGTQGKAFRKLSADIAIHKGRELLTLLAYLYHIFQLPSHTGRSFLGEDGLHGDFGRGLADERVWAESKGLWSYKCSQ